MRVLNSFYINNTNVSRKIRTEAFLNKYAWALVGKEKAGENSSDKKKTIENRYRLDTTDKNIAQEGVTYIDMMIADAVYSLYKTEQTSFSEGMILRALSGDDKQTCRKETKDRIRKSLEKMAGIDFTLDCKEEMKSRERIDFENIKDESFISLKKLKNGNYQNTNPPLYRYAETINQVIAIPSRLWSLDHKKPVNDSLENIAIKHYLLGRIAVANYDRREKKYKNLNKIYYYHPSHKKMEEEEHPFTGMLFDLGVVREWENENGKLVKVTNGDTEEIRGILSHLKNRTHKNTKEILNALQEMGYIKAYSEIKIGREIIGVEIEAPAKKITEFK